MQLDGLSLVCKYSQDCPNILVTGDETGKAYLIDTSKYASFGKSGLAQLPEMQPEST